MREFFLKDNQPRGMEPEGDEGLRESALFKRLGNRSLEKLQETERLFVFPPSLEDSDDLNESDWLMWDQDSKLATGNVMGFVGLGDDELVIGSRFTSNPQDDRFLHRMLEKVLHINIVDAKLQLDPRERRYAMLELLFPTYLETALQNGLYKTYVWRSYNDANVRGVIDIARFIKQDMPFMGEIAYNTREFSCDNEVMQLVRHAIEEIVSRTGANPFRKTVAQKLEGPGELRKLVRLVRHATPSYQRQDRRKVISANLRHPVRHRYYHAYRDLQRLCIEILRGHEVSLRGERDDKVHGILFNGAWLWEEYVASLMADAAANNPKLEFIHPRNRPSKNSESYMQHYFEDRVQPIYPDFISQNEPRIIMDAKYKPLGNRAKDYHQLLGYMYRFESRCGILVYPAPSEKHESTGGNTMEKLCLLAGISHGKEQVTAQRKEEVAVYKIHLDIPTESTDFECSEGKLISQIAEAV